MQRENYLKLRKEKRNRSYRTIGQIQNCNMNNQNARSRGNRKSIKNDISNNIRELPKINSRHITTDTGSSGDIRQGNYTYRTLENNSNKK